MSSDAAPGSMARRPEHPAHSPSDYTRWRGLAGTWGSIDAFVSAETHAPGAHLIEDDEGPLDVYVIGDPLHSTNQPGLPVFFSGAITNREASPGPYFSGLTIAREVGVSALAVADRTITQHRDLALAWYEGCADDRTGPQLARFLSEVQRASGKRLVLTGGSGGGFAALQMERRLTGISTAFCWNPQTDLLNYIERTTRRYLSSCHPAVVLPEGDLAEAHDDLRSALAGLGVATDCWTPGLPISQSVLYLQNAGDWHVASHAMPFVSGAGLKRTDSATFAREGVVMMLGNWGEGHSIPPREVLEEAVRTLATTPDPELAADHLLRSFPAILAGPGATDAQLRLDAPAAQTRPLNTFVYGSCVARDTIDTMEPGALTLAGYVARQSLISAMHPADPSLVQGAGLASRFQRRMLEGDAGSNLFDLLSEAARNTDLVLCDLTDERLGVYELADSSYLTRSVELIRSGLEADIRAKGRWLAFGTDEHFSLWQAALGAFTQRLDTLGLRERTLFLLVPWASVDTTGSGVAPSFGTSAHDANAQYGRYNSAVMAAFPDQVISLSEDEVRTDPQHRWGPSPFHYAPSTYATISARLADWANKHIRPIHPSGDNRDNATLNEGPPVESSEERASTEPTISQHAPGSVTVESGAAFPTRVAYHLYRGAKKVTTVGYGERYSVNFDDLPSGSYSCRIYRLDPASGDRSAATTRRLELETLAKGPALRGSPRRELAVAGRHSTAVLLALVLTHHHDLIGLVVEPSFVPELVCGIPALKQQTIPATTTVLDTAESSSSGEPEWQTLLEQELKRLSAMQMYRMARRLHLAGAEREARFLKTRIYQDFGCILPFTAEIGDESRLGYGGIGTVIHSRARIGVRCVIGQNVTIGARTVPPRIGDDVFIGPNSVVLAPEVGSGAVIGAGSVVLESVAPGAVVAGNPARIISTEPRT